MYIYIYTLTYLIYYIYIYINVHNIHSTHIMDIMCTYVYPLDVEPHFLRFQNQVQPIRPAAGFVAAASGKTLSSSMCQVLGQSSCHSVDPRRIPWELMEDRISHGGRWESERKDVMRLLGMAGRCFLSNFPKVYGPSWYSEVYKSIILGSTSAILSCAHIVRDFMRERTRRFGSELNQLEKGRICCSFEKTLTKHDALSDVGWFINPIKTIDISPINHSRIGVIDKLS